MAAAGSKSTSAYVWVVRVYITTVMDAWRRREWLMRRIDFEYFRAIFERLCMVGGVLVVVNRLRK